MASGASVVVVAKQRHSKHSGGIAVHRRGALPLGSRSRVGPTPWPQPRYGPFVDGACVAFGDVDGVEGAHQSVSRWMSKDQTLYCIVNRR